MAASGREHPWRCGGSDKRVAELEARLGVRLLDRTTRRLSLTAEGELFFARCKDLLQEVEQAEAEVSERSGEAVGSLKISAPVSYGVLRLAPLRRGFMAAHPRINRWHAPSPSADSRPALDTRTFLQKSAAGPDAAISTAAPRVSICPDPGC